MEKIARCHLAVWHRTYGDIAPAAAVRALDLDHRRSYWARELTGAPADRATLLAPAGDRIAGFVSFESGVGSLFHGLAEVRHLYVLPDHHGQGLGRLLLHHAFDRLAAADHRECGLAVVAQNHAARRFYARMGGREGQRFRDAGPIWRSDNILVTWPLTQG